MRSWQLGTVLFSFRRPMKTLLRLLQFATAALSFASSALAQDLSGITITPLNPGPDSEVIHDFKSGITIATNGVVVVQGTTKLTADTIRLNAQTGEAFAEGNVTLERDASLWRGERLEYNFQSNEIQADKFRIGTGPLFAAGQQFRASPTNNTYTATNSFFTSDDLADPAYRIRARGLKLIPGKLIEARNATVYAGNVPVLFFPFLSRRLESHPNFFVFTPAYRSLYGPYLLGSYHWTWNTNLTTVLNLDYRQKRGVGFGPDVNYDLGRWGKGSFSFYYLRDQDPDVDPSGVPIQSDREHLNFSHQTTLRTNLTAKVVVRQHSDAQFERDFFESEYRSNPQPASYMEMNQDWPNFNLNVLAIPQLNDFFQTIERLPDIKLTGFRQQLGVSPFFYEGENSAGYFRFQSAEGSLTNDYAAVRGDTFHQLLLPQTLLGWLNVTPRVGGRMTHYGETDGAGSTRGEQNRAVFNTGAEVSFKASRTWPGARNRLLDADGFRHIIQPSFNYAFVPSPSKAPRELPQFDTEIPSLRLLPIDYPDFNSIDSIDSQNAVRLTLHNKIQTKRRGEVENLLDWRLAVDWRLDPRRDQGTFSDFYSDLDLKPRSWLVLNSELRYAVEEGHLQMANHQATLEPNSVWALSLGHRYFRENPYYGLTSGNNLIHSSLLYRFNENWAGRITHHYEARDGLLEEQYYTLYRDLRSWTSALTLRIRDQRVRPTDFTIAITFSLKAFPRFEVNEERNKHNLLFGG